MWLGLLTAFILLVFIWGWAPWDRWRIRHIPGFNGYWLLGNLGDYAKGPQELYAEGHKKFGPVFKAWFARYPILVVGDGPTGRALARRCRVRTDMIGPVNFLDKDNDKVVDAEIFLVTKEKYHTALKAVWPGAFRQAKMQEYVAQMNTSIGRALQVLAEAAQQGRQLNLVDFYGDLAMDIVGSTAFGVDLDVFQCKPQSDAANAFPSRKLVEAVKFMFASAGASKSIYPVVSILSGSPLVYAAMKVLARSFPDSTLVKAGQGRHLAYDMLRQVMRDAQRVAGQLPPASSDDAKYTFDSIRLDGGGFMSHLVEERNRDTKEKLTEHEILGQAITFLAGGYETTAIHLSFTTYLLLKHPDKLAKLRKELDAVPQDKLKEVDPDTLPYLSAVQRESMRLYAVGNLLTRYAPCDMNVCGHFVPKGMRIHINLAHIGRNPDHWVRPDEFLPERWIPGDPLAASNPDDCLYGFGDGALQCAGMRFAKHEASLVLGQIFSKMDFVLGPGQEELAIDSLFALKPRDGVFVTPVIRASV